MPSPKRLLLLLTAALAISMATGEVSECSSFQYNMFGRCHDCPFGGLAMPRGSGCFEQLFVKRSLVCRYLGRLENCRHGVAQVARAHDLRRDEDFNSFNSDVAYATSLTFLFSTTDRPLGVERFLVWKKGCEVGVANYTFQTLYGQETREPMRAHCWAEDEGDFISVGCVKMVVYGLSIRLDNPAAATDCDIPAEVEVYGINPTPFLRADAKWPVIF